MQRIADDDLFGCLGIDGCGDEPVADNHHRPDRHIQYQSADKVTVPVIDIDPAGIERRQRFAGPGGIADLPIGRLRISDINMVVVHRYAVASVLASIIEGIRVSLFAGSMHLRQFVIQIADDPDMVALLQFENKKVLEILRIVNEAVFARMLRMRPVQTTSCTIGDNPRGRAG